MIESVKSLWRAAVQKERQSESESEREREQQRGSERYSARERERDTDRQKERQRARDKESKSKRGRASETERERENDKSCRTQGFDRIHTGLGRLLKQCEKAHSSKLPSTESQPPPENVTTENVESNTTPSHTRKL